MSVANHVGHQTWAKITSQVDSISGFPPEASSNTKDDKEQAKWRQVSGSNVAIVLNSGMSVVDL